MSSNTSINPALSGGKVDIPTTPADLWLARIKNRGLVAVTLKSSAPNPVSQVLSVGGASIGGVVAIFKLASLLPERVIFAYGGLGRSAAALSFPRLSFQESFAATMAILVALRVPREVAPAVA
jgi:hypothetical protein